MTHEASGAAFDVTDGAAAKAAVDRIEAETGPIDILINNAAQWLPGKLHDNDALAISQTITGIVTGTLLFTRGLIPLLEKSGAGDILNVVSISGIPNTPLPRAPVA